MFNNAVVTAKGLAFDAKVRAGKTVAQFTKVALGDGTYSGTEDLAGVTQLKNSRQAFGISSKTIVDERSVMLRIVTNNSGVSKGYHISEMGVFADDPDEGEILYSIALGIREKMDYQPSETELPEATGTFDFYVAVSNAKEVVIKLGSGAAASAEDLVAETARAKAAEKINAETIAAESVRATGVETDLKKNIDDNMKAVTTELGNRYTKDKVYTKEEVLAKIESLIGSAPEALDTLKEIADALGNDPDFAATMTTALAGKVDKETGKGLSANDYSDSEKGLVADVNLKKHTHNNKAVLDGITQKMLNDIKPDALTTDQLVSDTITNDPTLPASAAAVYKNGQSVIQIEDNTTITATASGTGSVTMSDAWDAPVRNLSVYGKSEQDVTTGAQLLDVSNYSLMGDGTLVTRDLGYTIVVTGKGAYSGAVFYLPTTDGKTITFRYDTRTALTGSAIHVIYYLPDETVIYGKSTETTLTIPSDATKIMLRIIVNNTATALDSVSTVTVTGLRVNIGSTALPWEPYTGGIPSPNPDHPQEIRSVENPVVVSRGSNWFNVNTYRGMAKSCSIAVQGTFITLTSSGLNTDIACSDVTNHNAQNIYYEVLPSTTYVMSWDDVIYSAPDNVSVSKFYVGFFRKDKTQVSFISALASSSCLMFTTPAKPGYVVVRFGWVQKTATADEIMIVSNVRINLGDTALPWSVYNENSVNLTGYTFRGIGDVRDRLECRDGVWGYEVKRTSVIIDGKTLKVNSINTGWNIQYPGTTHASLGLVGWKIGQKNFLSDKFICFTEDGRDFNKTSLMCHTTNSVLYLFIRNELTGITENDGTTEKLAKVNAWIQQNNFTVEYDLAEPTWTPFPDDIQQQLNELHIYSGDQACMYVVSDVVPDMEVEYIQDSNKVMQNLRLEMAEQEVDIMAAIEQLKITNNLS